MIVENSESAGDVGGSNGRTIAESKNSIDVLMLIAHRFEYRIGCRVRRLEMDGNRAVTPWIGELVTAIRDEHEIDAELSSGFVEAARLVAEFGGEEEESRHLLLF